MSRLFSISFLLFFSLSVVCWGFFAEPEKYSRSGKGPAELAPLASSNLDNAGWLYDLAMAYHEAKDYDNALRYMRRALSIKPKMAFLNSAMGDIFNDMGRRDSAIYYYETALNMHYEYLQVWSKLIALEPKYYANLGLLYTEKAEQYSDRELVSKGEENLKKYLERYPDGSYSDQCRTALTKLELIRKQAESRQQIQEQLRTAKARDERRKEDAKLDREEFRREKPYFVGISFYSVGIEKDQYFMAKNPPNIIDDSLSMKFFATTLNEFGLIGGYIKGPLFFKGSFHYGVTSSGKNYFLRDPIPYEYHWQIDSSVSPWDSTLIDSTLSTKDDIRPKVSGVNSVRLSVSVDYNFYYMNPLLLYIGIQAGFGSVTLDDSPYNNFKNIGLSGAGVGGGVMIRLSDFLLDLGYRRDIIGNSAGGTIALSGIYKFKL